MWLQCCTWHNHPGHHHSPVPSLSCSQGTCRHSVFEKVHLTLSSHLQAILKAVDSSCIDIVLRQAVPAVDNLLREEVETTVTTTTFFHQSPGMSPGNRVLSLIFTRHVCFRNLNHNSNLCYIATNWMWPLTTWEMTVGQVDRFLRYMLAMYAWHLWVCMCVIMCLIVGGFLPMMALSCHPCTWQHANFYQFNRSHYGCMAE